MPRTLAIVVVFLAIIGLVTVQFVLIGPELQRQFNNLIENFPAYSESIRVWVMSLTEKEWFMRFQENDFVSIEKLTSHFEQNAKIDCPRYRFENCGNGRLCCQYGDGARLNSVCFILYIERWKTVHRCF